MGYPASGYHMKMPAKARLADLFDGGVYEALPQPKVAQDPLKFRDSKKYIPIACATAVQRRSRTIRSLPALGC